MKPILLISSILALGYGTATESRTPPDGGSPPRLESREAVVAAASQSPDTMTLKQAILARATVDGRQVPTGVMCHAARDRFAYHDPTDEHGDASASRDGCFDARADGERLRKAQVAWRRLVASKGYTMLPPSVPLARAHEGSNRGLPSTDSVPACAAGARLDSLRFPRILGAPGAYVVDVDCDGRADTVRARRTPGGSAFTAFIHLHRPGRTDSVGWVHDNDRPELAAVGDVDGDGLRDLLFAIIDADVVGFDIVLVRRERLEVVPRDAQVDWRRWQFISDDVIRWDECADRLLPRLERTDAGQVVISIALEATDSACTRVTRGRLRIADGVLTVHSSPD